MCPTSWERQNRWTFVWLTDDGPSLGPIFDSQAEAIDGAMADWRGHKGGIAGGYETGSATEFVEMFESSPVLWVCPLG